MADYLANKPLVGWLVNDINDTYLPSVQPSLTITQPLVGCFMMAIFLSVKTSISHQNTMGWLVGLGILGGWFTSPLQVVTTRTGAGRWAWSGHGPSHSGALSAELQAVLMFGL